MRRIFWIFWGGGAPQPTFQFDRLFLYTKKFELFLVFNIINVYLNNIKVQKRNILWILKFQNGLEA